MRSYRRPRLMSAVALAASLLVPAAADSPPGAADQPPAHVVVIFMENHSASSIRGNPDVPFLNAFAAMGVRFRNYEEGDSAGPSLPDYLQLAAGSSCGKTSDTVSAGDRTISAAGCTTTVWNQLQRNGISWGVYMDAMPRACSPKVTHDSTHLDTRYALKHNPATPFPSIWRHQAMCRAHVLPYSSFRPQAMPAVSFIAPSICNDQHGVKAATAFEHCRTGGSGLMTRGDDWLAARVPAMLARGATVLITYDEKDTLYAAEVGPGIRANTVSDTPFTHYSVLAAIEQAYHLNRLHKAASATPLPL
ncbi:MAG: alkaline phosphatase family protein [Nocardioidaceae bacterium]